MKITLMIYAEVGRNNYFQRQDLQNECISLQEDKQVTLQ